jgi:hypothetical protein
MPDLRTRTKDYHPSLVRRDAEGYWWFVDAERNLVRGPYESEIAAEEGLYHALFGSPTWPR